jgi:hypothetical protein
LEKMALLSAIDGELLLIWSLGPSNDGQFGEGHALKAVQQRSDDSAGSEKGEEPLTLLQRRGELLERICLKGRVPVRAVFAVYLWKVKCGLNEVSRQTMGLL